MSGLLNVGATALMAAYTQMRTAGHNIANVDTPGYSRQEVLLGTAGGTYGGGGFVGRGVAVESIQRRYDQFVTGEANSAIALAAADRIRVDQLGRLDQVFSDAETGIGTAMDDLSSALADAVNRPFDPSVRTVVGSRAGALAERFADARARLDEMRGQADLRIRESINKLNSSLRQLASINDQVAKVASSGQPPNDLLDQRDQLVAEINQRMKANGYINADGTVSLFSASGQALVVGGSVAQFSLTADVLDPTRLSISLTTSGNQIPVSNDSLGGGELAGLMRFRDEDLRATGAKLGRLAGAISYAYNLQQSLGRDAAGVAGAAMFQVGAPQVYGSSENTGNAVIGATLADGSALLDSDYELRFDGTNWTATRLSDGQALSVGALPATLEGLQITQTSGTPQAGDRFLVNSASEFANDFAMILPSPSRLATGLAAMPQRGATNAGDVSVSAFRVSANDTNLTQPVSITFTSPTTFDVTGTGTGNPTGVAYTPGMTLNYNGWSMTLLGTPATNDTFTVGPTPNAATDNRNARLMLELRDQLNVGGQRASDAYGDLVADIGTRTQAAKASLALSSRTLEDAQRVQAETSGVNLDEEAARLLQFQQAYQAAAKVIATAQTVFDTLLQVTN